MDKVENILNEYYEQYYEEARLDKDKAHNIEFITTTNYIEKYLKPGDKIIEIGAATGRYSLYYAKKGYEVEAVDLVDKNLEILKSKIKEGMTIKATQANALDLHMFEDNTFDMTLCLGPLYHLFSDNDKLKAINEAIRITEPGGKIFFAYITNEAVILNYGLRKGNLLKLEKMCDDKFKVPDIPEEIFSVRYIKDFDKLMDNCKNIKKLNELATDGISATVAGDYVNALNDEEYKVWVKYHLANCEREDLMGYSSHILYIAEKK